MTRLRLATVWLAGCSGCHMALLDLDEEWFELAEQVEIVYSPVFSDTKQFPDAVDACLVEGAVGSTHDLALARIVRSRSRRVIALGDCAVTTNVPGLRNLLRSPHRSGAEAVLDLAYGAPGNLHPQSPRAPGLLPALLDTVLPLHAVIPVDAYLPGCAPSLPRLRLLLEALVAHQLPQLDGDALLRFG